MLTMTAMSVETQLSNAYDDSFVCGKGIRNSKGYSVTFLCIICRECMEWMHNGEVIFICPYLTSQTTEQILLK